MSQHSYSLASHQICTLRRQFVQTPGLPFSDLLSAERVEQVLEDEKVLFRDRVFSPLVTIWVFLSQVLSPDHCCREAVARLLAYRAASGLPSCSPRTGSYCKARQRLPENVLTRLVRTTGQELERQAPSAWLWKGRSVKIADGTIVSMPDTPDNQIAYPQQRRQAPGVGFPLTRLVALISLSCGAVLDLAVAPYHGKEKGETALFRSLWGRLQPGDVALGDRFYGSYFHLALLCERGVDSVFRLHQRRRVDFRCGQRLGKDDHIVTWTKPQRSDWLDKPTFRALPDALAIREVRVRVSHKGFRTRQLVVVTTLLNPAEITAQDLAELYRARWHAELDLRTIKTTMQMDILRCKTPEMVRKEIWAHLLAYNLLRTVMAQAALQHGLLPRTLSPKGALQTLNAFRDILLFAKPKQLPELCRHLLMCVASHRVGNRPDRLEPRARKRRAKNYPLLQIPRQQARWQLNQRTLSCA